MEQISAACEQQQNENYAEIFGNKRTRKKKNLFPIRNGFYIYRASHLFIYQSLSSQLEWIPAKLFDILNDLFRINGKPKWIANKVR